MVKTRVQLQTGKGTGEQAYSGMVDCFRKIIQQEGASRLYRGITAPDSYGSAQEVRDVIRNVSGERG